MGGQSPRVLTGRSGAVPFHRQSFDFTCGPACLLMAMGRFDAGLAPTRDLELDIWREANLVEAYATSRQGLALAAHRRGFRVHTQGNAETIELLDCLGIRLSPENRRVAEALHRDLKARCRRAGVRDAPQPVTLRDVRGWLARGWVPVVLVDARLVGDEDLPHWVVVTAADDRTVTLHDPLARSGETVAPVPRFARWLGFRGTTCAVVVEGPSQSASAQPRRFARRRT
ncbi:MAG: peptidase C39 family protein [Candidatus Thermoplasmatota archaeon]